MQIRTIKTNHLTRTSVCKCDLFSRARNFLHHLHR